MKKFSIPATDFDLELTMTCGQTFCWNRLKGELYGEGSKRFYTFKDSKPVITEQKDERLFIETELSQSEVEKALGLHHNLEKIFNSFPEDKHVEKAKEKLSGLRIVQDELFPCLISYLCSPQMRIPRIKQMHNEIAEKYGETVKVNGNNLLRFPTPEELSEATEEELRDLGIGYRAPYIVESTRQFRNSFKPDKVRKMDYQDARQELKKFHGAGNKVADCVLLFSLGFTEAYPLDTWALKTLEKHYPGLHSEKYGEASRQLRQHFGKHAGYAQEYLFHAARNDIIKV